MKAYFLTTHTNNKACQKGCLTHRFMSGGRALLLVLMLVTMNIAVAAEQLTLNFADTDINAVIGAVSEMTGQNFIVDPRVKGKVTIISKRPMDADDVYRVFLSILKVHGFAAIPGKNVIKIVPEVNAKQDAIPTLVGKNRNMGDAFVTQVIEVKHVNAAQLVPILRPLVPQRGHLAAYPSSNVLVISDSAANIHRIMKIIQRIDQATSDAVEIIKLNFASASEIVRVITKLMRQGAKNNISGSKLKIIADDRTNSILLGGSKSNKIRIRALIAHLDSKVDVGGSTHVVYLQYANAKDLVSVLTGVSEGLTKKGKGKLPAAGTGVTKLIIQADESTNALVIHAPPDIFRSLRAVIQKLDIRRAQILIEGVIATVSLQKSLELGVQWGVKDTSVAVGSINFPGSSGKLSGLLKDPPEVIGTGLSLALGTFTGSSQIAALISTLSSDSTSNILSTPSILTMDNEEAVIKVGRKISFTTGSFSNPGSGSGGQSTDPFNTLQREDVGLTLKIKPQVNEGNSIKLEIDQELSALEGIVNNEPSTSNRSITTSIIVEDGQMISIGGLLQEQMRENEEKVPGLGDIPILGWLFKYKKNVMDKTNFMMFLNPKILKDATQQTSLTSSKYNYLRGQQLDIRKRGISFYDDKESPLLPEFKEYLKLPEPYTNEQKDQHDQSNQSSSKTKTTRVIQPLDATQTPEVALQPPALDQKEQQDDEPKELTPMEKTRALLDGDIF